MPKKASKADIMHQQELLLSKERTILSFMRTGLAFVTAGIVVAGFFSNLQIAQIIGYILVGIGFVEVFESVRRLITKQKEINRLAKELST